MNFDPTYQPYRSTRYPIYAHHGMVATSSPQASAAGLEMLRRGGNAVDAAVATAAALTVVEPSANGIGGDAFALVWLKDHLYGLNGSGAAPRNVTLEKVLARHPSASKMPAYGWTPITVPGAPKSWAALNKRFGKLPLEQVLEPAIGYAREGYPIAPNLAKMFAAAFTKFSNNCTGPEFAELYKTFFPQGGPPKAGDIITLPNHANTLQAIAASAADDFYRGGLAAKIIADSNQFGGFFCPEDLAEYDVEWVEPIAVNYRGYDIWEIPPNGQGIVALMALNILKEFDFPLRDCADTFHKQWEAVKIAFADAIAYVSDPKYMQLSPAELISPSYGRLRALDIGFEAREPEVKKPPQGGTVYLCTADAEGNMVSYIQSNYMGFGSGIVVRDTGISLQNRGHDFSLDPTHINCLAPQKKSYHTIIPGFITKAGRALGPFGVMGGYMQPQGHVQAVMNLVDFGLNPQQALDAPRWRWMLDKRIAVEDTFSAEIARQLVKRGHNVTVELENTSFGRGQMILRLENGVLVGATESRTDSNISCY